MTAPINIWGPYWPLPFADCPLFVGVTMASSTSSLGSTSLTPPVSILGPPFAELGLCSKCPSYVWFWLAAEIKCDQIKHEMEPILIENPNKYSPLLDDCPFVSKLTCLLLPIVVRLVVISSISLLDLTNVSNFPEHPEQIRYFLKTPFPSPEGVRGNGFRMNSSNISFASRAKGSHFGANSPHTEQQQRSGSSTFPVWTEIWPWFWPGVAGLARRRQSTRRRGLGV